jgi:hypothetical protein
MAKLIQAKVAIEKAKKNALKRKAAVKANILAQAQMTIEKMVEDGVVRAYVAIAEDDFMWGAELAKADLIAAGYEVTFEKQNEEDEDETPDMVISIEHLK